ncbi:hypothetical protein Acr_05g0005690 [Actinidia rufa]|uniref:DUF4378 domain-containing protein n=1 Tax=Actinidia rufa TaxID=165716 RepID=A0A7J0EKL4_9ERIC|nr:hypothetical protein Acr_05g0005690 [Actinidia rufa]
MSQEISAGQSGNHGMEPKIVMQKNIGKNPEEVVKEMQRVYVDSSRTSVSSTCSSTFSSVDCSKTAKRDPSSLGHSVFPDTPSQMLPTKQPNSSSLDLRDIVKDSINRETGGLLVKTRTTAEGISRVVKHIDSPRPLQPYKPVKPKVSGLDGSPRVLAKLREAPSSYKEERSRLFPPKDSPRRERSIRAASESRANYLLDDLQRRNVNSSQALTEQEPGSNKRPSSVVVKLMGLEAFPDSMSANNDQMRKINCCCAEMKILMQCPPHQEKLMNASKIKFPVLQELPRAHMPLLTSKAAVWTTPTIKGTGLPKNFESSVVYTKSAKVVQKPRNSCSLAIPIEGMSGLRKFQTGDNVANDMTPRNNYFRQPSCQPLCSMDKSTNAKHIDQHNLQRHPNIRAEGTPQTLEGAQHLARRQLSKQQIESGSPRRKFRPKSLNWQEGDDQWSELSSETRQLSYQGDSISVQSESNTSFASQTDIEVTSIEARLSEDKSKAETATATMEQPSPVSVLDTTFYREGSPSPVKKISNAFKGEPKERIELPDDERSNEKIGQSKFNEKIHRKMTFDTVNEILARKLTSAGFLEPWILPNKLRARSLTGRKLLKELSLEVDHLQANSDGSLHGKDLMLETPNWADAHSEIPGIVLDIERLIFKDLISEVVSSEGAGLPDRSAKHYRRLFL